MTYRSSDGGRGVGKAPNYVTKAQPAFRFKVPGGSKSVDTYGEVVKAWRAGVISDFYYGTRSDTDKTLIWIIDGEEFAKSDLDGVIGRLNVLARRSGIVGIEWGETWCGYRALIVRFSGGIVVTQAYNGLEVVETSTREEVAA